MKKTIISLVLIALSLTPCRAIDSPTFAASLSKTLLHAKHFADSILIENYGQQFYDKHIIWKISDSIMEDYSNEVYDFEHLINNNKQEIITGKYFRLFYQVQFYDKPSRFPIQIVLDSVLNLASEYTGIYEHIFYHSGIENRIKKGKDCPEVLSLDKAYEAAIKQGYQSKRRIENNVALVWEFDTEENLQLHNGKWKIYVVKHLKDVIVEDYFETTYKKCDFYEFNPWTKEFLGRRKMKIEKGHNLYSSFFEDPKGKGFRNIFGSRRSIPKLSFDSAYFHQLNTNKRLTGAWISEQGRILIFNKDKSYGTDEFFLSAVKDSVEYKTQEFIKTIECNRYWHADNKRIKFFEKSKGRFENDTEFQVVKYKVTRNKLFILLEYREKWKKNDEDVMILTRIN